MPKVHIIRHVRENLKKCSLTPLQGRDDLQFTPYPFGKDIPDLSGAIVLSVGAPLLEEASSLCLIDATWQLASKIDKQLPAGLTRRSLPPGFVTAYPRRQTGCLDPLAGLASVEALFVAYHVLGWDTKGLLDHYYWRDLFLSRNERLLSSR